MSLGRPVVGCSPSCLGSLHALLEGVVVFVGEWLGNSFCLLLLWLSRDMARIVYNICVHLRMSLVVLGLMNMAVSPMVRAFVPGAMVSFHLQADI